MIITCKACNTSFNLDDKMIKPTGSKVRCSVCTKVFIAFPEQAPPPEPVVEPVEPVEPDTAPEAEPTPKADLAAAAAIGTTASATDAPDEQAPGADLLEKDADALLYDRSDLDFALEDEPEDGVSDIEIEDAVSDALNEDPPEPESEPDLALQADTDNESGATVIASLDDDDFDLDLSPEETSEDGASTVIANLDEELDFLFDEQPDVAQTVVFDLDQEDFDLDVPPGSEDDPNGTDSLITSLDLDELTLDSDFPPEPETVAGPEVDAPPETLDSPDDLDFSLDMEPEDEAAEASLDDLSLEFDLEPDADMAEAPSAADAGMDGDDELDLALDLDDGDAAEIGQEMETPVLEDDLDLSSLEGLLKDDDENEDDTVTMVIDEGEEPELTLAMDDETSAAEGDLTDMAGETLEDLEFDLDADSSAETLDIGAFDDDDQEIDLSEIEKMLEEPESGGAEFSSVPEQDLDLDIEASLETEKWMSGSGEDGPLVKDEELDLSEFEQVLENVDTEERDDITEEPDLELELDDGEVSGTPTETTAVDRELDLDLSDFEEDLPPTAGAGSAARESLDMELEFEVEGTGQAEQTLEDEGLEETVAIPDPEAEKTEKAPPETDQTTPLSPGAPPVKKGVSKSLVFLLIIVILGGGGYGTYYLLNQNSIEIPFLSDYLKPKVNDPGNLKMTTSDINAKFVDNASVGKLFVISGKVKNGYADNRGMITLQGNIFSKGKVQVKKERVYCGNIMSDLELANLEWDKIKARLANRLGDNRSNVKIQPGASIPFMVVFSSLPDDLEEYTIEVTGSTSLK